MLVSLQAAILAEIPLKVTTLWPCVFPKLEPEMVTAVPIPPVPGAIAEITGVGVPTVNETPLLGVLFSVTTTLPVVALLGTMATIWVSLQLETAARMPLKVTVLVVCVAPKPEPVMVTVVPGEPEEGEMPEIVSVPMTKRRELLTRPLTMTLTRPVMAPVGTGTVMEVALQLVGKDAGEP